MYYRDLSFYRTGGHNGFFEVYPHVRNVGWLGIEEEFSTGVLPGELIQKLKELVFIDVKNQESIKNGTFERETSIIVDQMLVRGSPYQCPFSDKGIVSVYPSEVECYSGERIKVLGLNEIFIPSEKSDVLYCCPTLICHYVEVHGYLPPAEFIDALSNFDLNKAYDSGNDKAFDYCVDVPAEEIDSLTLENINEYPESEEC